MNVARRIASILVCTPLLVPGMVLASPEDQPVSMSRSWMEKDAMGRLREAVSSSTTESWAVMVLWQVADSSQGELTELEREEVVNTLEVAARDRLSVQPSPQLRLEVLVREVWRPHRALNLLLFAIPIPGTGPLLATRGGIGIAFRVVDLSTRQALAEFPCRRSAGLDSIAGLMGRAADAKAAARSCIAQAVQAMELGKLPAPIFPPPPRPEGLSAGQ